MPRRPFKARPFQPLIGDLENPVFSRGTILDNGVIGAKPRSRTSLEASRTVPGPEETENDLYALNTLQLRRGWPLDSLSVQIPMEYLCDNLPPGCRERVGIATCGETYIFNCDDEDFDRRIRKVYRKWPEFWDIFRTSEYVFWPIQTERGYYVTASFHMERGQMDDPNFDSDGDLEADIPQVPNPQFSIVGAWSVVDGQRGAVGVERVNRVKRRIRRIFDGEGIQFYERSFMRHRGNNGERWNEPWVPPHSDDEDWSSGIRSFAIVRQLLQRVLDIYCYQAEYEDDFFREPCCGWLNVDQVRHEMMGICAINVMEDMDWNARLAVECIQRISSVRGFPPFDAGFLAPYNNDKRSYVPETDVDGVPSSRELRHYPKKGGGEGHIC
ncbi:hypothetical protein E0Z10_g5139 [Xylaria hypoxylon]|uniref:Uncharacterized protein n=1 Tax=Xylaria hypoxylon TaxID=37992 RepID=A0A4Z0YYN2_9PEZI|nr:hypothetical protein E0Z10_g5139 [Xylaria hypoxylon]